MVVKTCNPTDPTKPGHAIVIVHYLDKITNIRTFLIGEESSYIERNKVNATGAPVFEKNGRTPKKESFRRFPQGVATNAARKAHIRTNANYATYPLSQFVLRENTSKMPLNYKYTLQRPNGIWGFPKGSGEELASKDIALREFKEEIGYSLDPLRLEFKTCVDVEYWDKDERKQKKRQSVVFHYEVRNVDDTEKNAILTSFQTNKTALREGELFHVGFLTKAAINAKSKNEFSTLAFSTFDADHATAVDQTTIPRGGIVVPAVAPVVPVVPVVAPAPASAKAKYIPPHLRTKYGGSRRKSRHRMTRKRK
jgi:ADP-ribose pyrophosphatase YjhB (NUDIX family)